MTIRPRHVFGTIAFLGAIWLMREVGVLEIIDSLINDPVPSVDINR